jgi:cyclase
MPEHFTIVEVAPGVHAAIAGTSGAAVSNAAIIDTGDKTLVVDTFQTPQAAAELRATAVDLTGRDAFLVVNSHWHDDHTYGNQAFADTPIVSTRTTLELIVANAPADLAVYEQEIDGYLTAQRQRLESEDPAVQAAARRALSTLGQVKEAIPGFRLTLPDVLIEGSLVIAGETEVEIVTYGGGHTDSDVFVWVPDRSVLVTGDLSWNGLHPRSQDGHPTMWAEILERMLDLGPHVVINGHGDPSGPEVLAALVPYFRAVADGVEQVKGGADPAEIPLPAGSEAWDGEVRLRTALKLLGAK